MKTTFTDNEVKVAQVENKYFFSVQEIERASTDVR